MADFIFNTGSTGNPLYVNSSGALNITTSVSGAVPYSFGQKGHPLFTDANGSLLVNITNFDGSGFNVISNVSGLNLGNGSGIFAGKTDDNLLFKSLSGGPGVTISDIGSQLQISASGSTSNIVGVSGIRVTASGEATVISQDSATLSFDATTPLGPHSVGTPVTYSQTFSGWIPASANEIVSVGWGIVTQSSPAKIATLGRHESVSHGLSPIGDYLYVGNASGTLSASPGTIDNPIIYVESADAFHILPWRASESSVNNLPIESTNTFYSFSPTAPHPIGTPLYHSTTPSSGWIAAQSNSSLTIGWAVSLSSVVNSEGQTLMSTGGRVNVFNHGIGAPGEFLFVGSGLPGTLTNIEPNGSGIISNPIIYVEDTNNFHILPYRAFIN